MPDEILPCPFCGSTELHAFEHHEGEESFGFQCARCWMTGPQFASKAEAITAWNTRINSTAPSDGSGGCTCRSGESICAHCRMVDELEGFAPQLPEYGFDTFVTIPATLRDRILAALRSTRPQPEGE